MQTTPAVFKQVPIKVECMTTSTAVPATMALTPNTSRGVIAMRWFSENPSLIQEKNLPQKISQPQP